jgi:SAM-dependent methyltransferase
MNLLWGKAIATSISAMAKLGVADRMSAAEPITAGALAAAVSAHPESLYRVMRMLAGIGVFAEHEGQRFTLTPLSQCLRGDAPDTVRGVARFLTDEWHMRGYENILEAIRTGESGVQKAYGQNAFEAIAAQPEALANFQEGMSNYSAMEGALLDPLLDFSRFTRLADVGGGHGMLLAQILGRNPNLQGVLYDLPEVVEQARQVAAPAERMHFEAGSMFERVPAGCDAYIMKHIVHDWSDEASARVLRLMRDVLAESAPEHGRVFLAEMIVPPASSPGTPEPHPAKFLDVEMLAMTPGGKERTTEEFAALFRTAGLELVGVERTPGPICLIEARVAR